jgi:hypothetical protein
MLRDVEQGARRRSEDSDRVQSSRCNLSEVSLDNFEVGELVTVRVGHERPVRHSANVELLVTDEEELAVSTWASLGAGTEDVFPRLVGRRRSL